MNFRRRIWIGLLSIGLVGTAGCSVQDPTQPAIGSISVGARKDNSLPSLPPGKTKAGQANRK